jgi:small-conductance mechanosensitive channel
MEIFGIKLIGINADTGRKLLLVLGFIGIFLVLRYALTAIERLTMQGRRNQQTKFWVHQAVSLALAGLLVVGIVSIFFNDQEHLTAALGFVTAGLAFALQKVITSIAAYFVILRGQVFRVGDRILMSGVRGDVIALGFTRTTIMEMGQPPGERPDQPKVWIKSRQFTGRIVTVTNDKIFESPVFNYTRDFPYLWEEMTIPVPYRDNRERAEEIVLEAARKNALHADDIEHAAIERMKKEYNIKIKDLEPHIYWHLSDNWLEMSVRFLAHEHGSREMKDKMSRQILAAFDEAGISIASSSFEVSGIPPIKIALDRGQEIKPNPGF